MVNHKIVSESTYSTPSDSEIKKLIGNQKDFLKRDERIKLEYKGSFDDSKYAWVSILVDIVSMANTEGGLIIIGISDDGKHIGVDQKLFRSFDPANVNNKLRAYSPNSSIEINSRLISYYRKYYICLGIPEIKNIIIFDKDGNYQDNKGETKAAFWRGVVYFRKPGGKMPATQSDIESKIREISEARTRQFLAKLEHVASMPSETELVAVNPNEPTTGYRIKQSGEAEPVRITKTGEPEVSLSRVTALIKEKRIPVINPGKLRAGQVVVKVSQALGAEKKFSQSQHTQAWRYYGVRPPTKSDHPDDCDTQYCQYDEPHKDYVYTDDWVEFLIKKLKNDDEYKAVIAYKSTK